MEAEGWREIEMTSEINIIAEEVASLWGDPHPLLEQLGAPDESAATELVTTALQLKRIESLPALKDFLSAYRSEILVPMELPVILQAYLHTVRHEVRELIALDNRLADDPKLKGFTAASCRVGQRQLSRLRALRDHRVVQRYLAAVEKGEAHGWHTLVYGVMLGVFSLPPRQGLMSYAHRTLGGFIEGAAQSLRLSAEQCQQLHAEASATVPEAVQAFLAPAGKPQLRIA